MHGPIFLIVLYDKIYIVHVFILSFQKSERNINFLLAYFKKRFK